MMDKPLNDLTVVSLEQAVAAPYCSRLFAEGGARVIKLERPEGDFARAYDSVVHRESAYFVWLNAGKESISVDLRLELDRELLKKMLVQADVFIENLKPGSLSRLGFGYDVVREINPQIVMCSISGYGTNNDYANMKAYDALIQAETGLCSVTGTPGQPAKVGASICDIATGLTAYGEILKALHSRSHSNTGAYIECSLFETLAEWMAVPLAYYEYGGKLLQGSGMDHSMLAPYGAFDASDGAVFIVIQNQREWQRLCVDVLDLPALVEDARFRTNSDRVENVGALREAINEVFRQFTRKQLFNKLDAAQIAFGNINDVSDLGEHPALKRKEVSVAGKPVSIVARTGDNNRAGSAVPALDEHGDRLRAEFA